MVRPIVNSKKHYVQLGLSNIAQGANLNTTILSVIEGAPATAIHCMEGARVKAVWVEVWLNQDSASAVGSFTAGFLKNPGGANPILTADAAALHDYDNKKNIFYVTQGIAPTTDSALMLLYKGWIKIPRSKQRMGLGDQLQFFVRNNNAGAVDINVCGIFVYKEYR